MWSCRPPPKVSAYVSVSGAAEADAVHAARRDYLPALGVDARAGHAGRRVYLPVLGVEAVADEPRAGYFAAGYSAGHIDVRRQDVRSIAVVVAADVQVVAVKSCRLGNNLAIINYL